MKRQLIGTVILLLALSGCQNQHLKQKELARQRWNQARSDMALDLAKKQFAGNELKKAARTVSDVLEYNPQYAPAHLLLGQIYLEQGQPAKARGSFEQCLKIQPDQHQAHYFLGVIYEIWDQQDKALEHYNAAWQGQPDNVPYLLAVAQTMVAQDKAREALKLLTGQMTFIDRDAAVYLAAGNIYCRLGDYNQAVKMFREAKTILPDSAVITETLAFALYQAGMVEEALPLLEKLSPENRAGGSQPEMAYDLAVGDCHLKLQQYHEAQKYFERVSKLDPGNWQIWTRLAQVGLGRGDLDRAAACAEKALALAPEQSDALLVRGYIALQQKNYQTADATFRRIIDADNQNEPAYRLLGQSLEQQGHLDQAKQCYATAEKISPN